MKDDGGSPRKYGLMDPTPYVVEGSAKIEHQVKNETCPHCKSRGLMFLIRVELKDFPSLKGGSGFGLYVGCAACPFASPMMITPVAPREEKKD